MALHGRGADPFRTSRSAVEVLLVKALTERCAGCLLGFSHLVRE